MPNLDAEYRDKQGPVWDMSQERVFLENLLSQRFNFFLIFFGFVLNGSMSSRNQTYLCSILFVGTVVCWVLALALMRSQLKLDIILRTLFEDETHPAAIVDMAAKALKFKIWSMRRAIGYVIPPFCCLVLTLGAILAATGILRAPR